MKLFDLLNILREESLKIHNINSVHIGDVYELNEMPDIKYSTIVVTQNQHTANDNFIIYNLNIFYIDRLTANEDNKLIIQSHAIDALENLFYVLENTYQLDIDVTRTYQPFTERFSSLCAGVYVTLNISVPNERTCNE